MQIAVVAPPSDTGISDYLSSEGIIPDILIFADGNTVPVAATPTLLLVDRTGAVTNAWFGLLTPDQEAEVFELLGVQ